MATSGRHRGFKLNADGTQLDVMWEGVSRLAINDTGVSLFGGTPVAQQAALTAQDTTITHTAPGTADYAIQNLTSTTPFGFVTADEGNTVLKVIKNLQTRLAEVEAALEAVGLVDAN